MREKNAEIENEKAIKEIFERLYYCDLLEYNGEISDISKFFLLQALIENRLKMMDLSYECVKKDELITYKVKLDSSICAIIILTYQRIADENKIEPVLDMEIYMKKDIRIQKKELTMDLLKFLDKINATSSGGVVSTIDSVWDLNSYQAKGIVARKKYKGFSYPFIEVIDDFSQSLKECFVNLADIDLLLIGENALDDLIKKRCM